MFSSILQPILLCFISVALIGCVTKFEANLVDPLAKLSALAVPFPDSSPLLVPYSTMEDIVASLDVFDGVKDTGRMRLEYARSFVSGGFDDPWIGKDWIDLFEGDGDYIAVAVEKMPEHVPLKVKVIYWVATPPVGYKGSVYEAPRYRYEYFYQLGEKGWMKARRTVKTGTKLGDRVYSSDGRNAAKVGKGQVVSDEVYSTGDKMPGNKVD